MASALEAPHSTICESCFQEFRQSTTFDVCRPVNCRRMVRRRFRGKARHVMKSCCDCVASWRRWSRSGTSKRVRRRTSREAGNEVRVRRQLSSVSSSRVVESFFRLLKRERVHRRRYRARAEARQDVFDYIERFYNRQRPHGSAHGMSPLEFEAMSLNQTVHESESEPAIECRLGPKPQTVHESGARPIDV
jgi:hypothetical protein